MLWTPDTNILCYLMQPNCPEYAECERALSTLRRSGERIILLSQVSTEFWFFLTRPATGVRPGLALSPVQADVELRQIERLYEAWPDVPAVHSEWRQIVVQCGVSGTATYDARLAAAAHMHSIPNLLTYNVDHFKRYAAFLNVVHPKDV